MIHLLIYVAATCMGLYVVVSHFRRSKSNSAQTQELGFLPPPAFPSRPPAAIDLIIEEIWAVRKDRWLELVSERFQAIGCALLISLACQGANSGLLRRKISKLS